MRKKRCTVKKKKKFFSDSSGGQKHEIKVSQARLTLKTVGSLPAPSGFRRCQQSLESAGITPVPVSISTWPPLHVSVSSLLLRRTPIIGFRTHRAPGCSHPKILN